MNFPRLANPPRTGPAGDKIEPCSSSCQAVVAKDDPGLGRLFRQAGNRMFGLRQRLRVPWRLRCRILAQAIRDCSVYCLRTRPGRSPVPHGRVAAPAMDFQINRADCRPTTTKDTVELFKTSHASWKGRRAVGAFSGRRRF